LPEKARDIWRKKHPDTDYNQAGGMFVAELRKAIPGRPIMTLMAYRDGGYYPHIDYDLEESYGTARIYWGGDELEMKIYIDMKDAPRNALQDVFAHLRADVHLEDEGLQRARETFFRPWDGRSGYKEHDKLRREAERRHPHVKGIDLNYLHPWYVATGATKELGGEVYPVYTTRINRPAIFYGYALSRLSDRIPSTSEIRSPARVRDGIFFLDLGRPLEDDYRELEDVAVRYFENGFVVVTRGNGVVRFRPDEEMIPEGTSGLWDAYEGVPAWEWELQKAVSIHPDFFPAVDTYRPSGRVYAYRGNQNYNSPKR
jgi:hypothetical protein